MGNSKKDIEAILSDRKLVGSALAAGVREALRRHAQAGQSVVEWRDGKTVWVSPEEITRRLAQMENKSITGIAKKRKRKKGKGL